MEKDNKIKNTKFIFVTGGVISGLGKGIISASLGRILKSKGFSVFAQKIDPYLNYDSGLMSPNEHGEVYVTKDGKETDLDLGHYERFIGESLTKEASITSGNIYKSLIEKERRGDFQGKTVQIIPHVTNYIEEFILKTAEKSKTDFVITEIGGTVGDIESDPFLHAISSLHVKHNTNIFFVHLTYIPFLEASKEFKTKPTQNSIKKLRQFGINPNMLVVRSGQEIDEKIIEKIVDSSNIRKDSIINVADLDNVYKVPLVLEKQKSAEKILEYFDIENKKSELSDWNNFVNLIDYKDQKEINVAMIGKYIKLKDSYFSIIEALKISSIYKKLKINLHWINSDDINDDNISEFLKNMDGALILPGFGKRGFDGKVIAAQYLKEQKIPTLGICYGFQAMVVAQAKHIGYKDAISTENESVGTPIIDIIASKRDLDYLGGTLRLGEHETTLVDNTLIKDIYKQDSIFERHRHRYEVNPDFKKELEVDDFVFSGYDKNNDLSEICEYKGHPFYIGVQFHPEFNAKPLSPHPLFDRFIDEVINFIK